MNNLETAMEKACSQAGVVPRAVPADGRWHQLDIEGDPRGKGDARVRLFPDGAGGVLCNWKGETVVFFAEEDRESFTAEEKAERQRRRRKAIAQAQADREAQAKAAAGKALAIWRAAKPSTDDHPYLRAKGIKPVGTLREIMVREAEKIIGYAPRSAGEPLTGRLLLAPVKVGTAMSTVEMIDEAGRKSALAGGTKGGGYWAAQKMPAKVAAGTVVQVAEGVATALSAREATGYLTVAALCRTNIEAVATVMRADYPGARLLLLADLGPGEEDTVSAAEKVSGVIVVRPSFAETEITKWNADHGKPPKDFNDMHVVAGLERVLSEINRQAGIVRASDDFARRVKDIISGEYQAASFPWRYITDATQALLPGKVTVLAGGPGAAKSFALLQCSLHWEEQGLDWATMALEDDLNDHLQRALAQQSEAVGSHFTSAEWIRDNPALAQSEVTEYRDFIDRFSQHWFPARDEDTLDDIAKWIETEAKRGRRIIAVDPITYAEKVVEPWIADQRFIKRVKATAKKYGSSLLLVNHLDMHGERQAGGCAYPRFVHTEIWFTRIDPKEFMVYTQAGPVEMECNMIAQIRKARNGSAPAGAKVGMWFDGRSLKVREMGLIVKQKKKKSDQPDDDRKDLE